MLPARTLALELQEILKELRDFIDFKRQLVCPLGMKYQVPLRHGRVHNFCERHFLQYQVMTKDALINDFKEDFGTYLDEGPIYKYISEDNLAYHEKDLWRDMLENTVDKCAKILGIN